MDEIKEMLKSLMQMAVHNSKDEKKVENEDKGDDMDVKNEKTDKRKLIDEVAGIMKSAGCDDEVIRTAIGKMEKIGYDESEAGTADNKKVKNEVKKEVENKCKNEDEEDKKEVKEIKEEVKKDVENKCKNSVNNAKDDYFARLNKIYNSANEKKNTVSEFKTRDERLADGNRF